MLSTLRSIQKKKLRRRRQVTRSAQSSSHSVRPKFYLIFTLALFFGGTTLVSAQTIDTSTEAPELQGELDPELQHHQQTCISIPATSHGVPNSAPLETNIASPNDVLVEAKTLTLQREVFQYIASYVEADARSTTSLKQFIKITEGLCQRRDIAAIAISTEIDPANPGTATSVTVAVTGRDLVHRCSVYRK